MISSYLLFFVILGGSVTIALRIRARLPHRELLGAWIVVGTVIVSFVVALIVGIWNDHRLERARRDEAIDRWVHPDKGLCAHPPPEGDRLRPLYDLNCSSNK